LSTFVLLCLVSGRIDFSLQRKDYIIRAEKGNILEIEEAMPDDEVRAIYGLQDSDDKVFEEIKIYGYISSCEVGHGRHSADR
jgi:hypothetical protein